MKFVFFRFSVSENGENGFSDEGADGGNAARNFGLEPPLLLKPLNRMRYHLAGILVWP